jgi:hypothetical protein
MSILITEKNEGVEGYEMSEENNSLYHFTETNAYYMIHDNTKNMAIHTSWWRSISREVTPRRGRSGASAWAVIQSKFKKSWILLVKITGADKLS